jgi:hypothetical protein
MTIVYHRNNYQAEALDDTVDHVRSHISSIASDLDNGDEYYDDVLIEISQNEDGSTRVFGSLDQDPACDYSLPEDYEAPPETEYQMGFGVREMTPAELHEHLLQKEHLE